MEGVDSLDAEPDPVEPAAILAVRTGIDGTVTHGAA